MTIKSKKIHGVKIMPRWQWSDWYTAEVRNGMRRASVDAEASAIKYATWLLLQDGSTETIDAPDARVVHDWSTGKKRIRAVQFGHRDKSRSWQPYYRSWEQPFVPAITVPIPNWDHEPKCIDMSNADLLAA